MCRVTACQMQATFLNFNLQILQVLGMSDGMSAASQPASQPHMRKQRPTYVGVDSRLSRVAVLPGAWTVTVPFTLRTRSVSKLRAGPGGAAGNVSAKQRQGLACWT